jgi:DNA (cytosine-5)-methyltransferase 1
MNEELKTMHLFAGAGGGILADLILGHRPIVAVEWDKYACEVLRARVSDGWFEGMSVWEGDVRLFDPSDYKGRVDCIHAGFPCQDISQAGSQRGVGEDTRSGLYRQVLRIADEIQPRYLFLENVSAIVSGDNGNMLRTVVGDLTNRGYDCVWRCLSASEVGANHVRGRWWLLAYPNCNDESECTINGSEVRMVADSNSAHGTRKRIPCGIQKEQLSNSRCSSEYRKPGWWQSEPDVGRVADGVASASHRLKALGNGQVPLQCATAFKILWEEHNAIKTASRKGGSDVKGITS